MAFCDNCGHELRSTAKFCGACGTRVQENTEEPPNETKASEYRSTYVPSLSQFTVKKTRTGLVVMAILMLIFPAGVYVIPINDLGWSIAQSNDICQGPIGLLGQPLEEIKQ